MVFLPLGNLNILIVCWSQGIFVYLKTMSTIGRKELASNEKAYKYQFSLEILQFSGELPLPCSIRFMWKRNNKSIETKNTYDAKPGFNQMSLNQKLSNISTIIFNTDTKTFLAKESEIIVNMYFSGAPKKLASFQLDMRKILDSKDTKANRSQVFQGVSVKQSRECKLMYKLGYRLSCFFKEEIVPSQKSLGGPLNTSGFSMQQDKYFQKKYDIPSKDNHSVTSYNTGIRFPSASKRERDDSSSIRKYDYGYLTGLKSNISMNPANKDFDTHSGMKSIDNKTEMNEGNYMNRQLIDQQNKRSKAQAELSRNKVEIAELKKKINQLSIQNMKMKEELKNTANSHQAASKEEINSLQFKLYELNNQIREVKNQLELKKREADRLEADFNRITSDKKACESQLLNKQKKIQELQRAVANTKIIDTIQTENSDLKYQIENLRKYIEEIKKQYADQQAQIRTQKFRESQELNSQIQYLRRQNEKIRSKSDATEDLQRKLIEYQERLKNKSNQTYLKDKNIQQIERELEEYKNRLSQFENERAIMQREMIRIKQQNGEKIIFEKDKQQIQAKAEWLGTENSRLTEELRYYQRQLQEALQNLEKVRKDQGQSQGRSAKLLPQINQLQKRVNEYESENNILRSQKTQILRQKQEMQREIEHLREDMFKSTASTTTNPQVDRLFRESLQLQVELKFANDQLARLRGLQQALDNQKWRADKQQHDRIQLEQECERIEKELVNKNRALMIEVEKTKMMNEQLNQHSNTVTFYKEQLEKNRAIIYNLQEQLNDLSILVKNQKNDYTKLQEENIQLRAEKQRLAANRDQVRNLQDKIRQLQSRNNQKMQSLQNMNRNLMMAKGEIKDLQDRNQQLHRQLVGRDKTQYDLQNRCKDIQKQKTLLQSQMGRFNQQKRILEKRNEVIMEQMHVMKKRFEEQKGRSLSFTRNEEFNKVRTLQSEIQKKEKAISKLNKQKLELEQQNVKINVQVMKLLSELQKLKASSNAYSTQNSFKTIAGIK